MSDPDVLKPVSAKFSILSSGVGVHNRVSTARGLLFAVLTSTTRALLVEPVYSTMVTRGPGCVLRAAKQAL